MFERRSFIYRFILGPSFAECELTRLFVTLTAFPEVLLSPYLACSGRFLSLLDTSTAPPNHSIETDYTNSTKAVKELRKRGSSDGPYQEGDLQLTVILGLGIVTFDLLDSGLHAHRICRYTLGLLDNHHAFSPELEDGLLPLIFMDTCNCLVRRQIPVYRSRTQKQGHVDRYIGLCVPLLSHMYELCCISSELSDGLGAIDEAIGEALSTVQEAIATWNPVIDEEANVALTSQESCIVVEQASIYRTVLLLVIHRLRHPVGTQDELAAEMAEIILHTVQGLYKNDQKRGVDRYTEAAFEYRMTLPFLVAGIELQDPLRRTQAMQILELVCWKKMYSTIANSLRDFLLFVWATRDAGWNGHWFDLAAHGPSFVLL
ncbi:hypothetical protein OQA88_5648 [Cercophora sp. LCS_1]